MKITLYDHAYETLAIQFLASTLKTQGIDFEIYYDCSMNKDYLDQDFFLASIFSLSPEQVACNILRTDPDIVGFSLLTPFYQQISKIISSLKMNKPNLTIIAGGPHCNVAPVQTLENRDIDFIFLADADKSLLSFLSLFQDYGPDELKTFPADRVSGVSNMLNGRMIERGLGPLMQDIDKVPFPEKDPYYAKNPSLKNLYTTTASRGCIFQCTYCNSNNLRKIYREAGQVYFRSRSPKNIIQELQLAKEKYNPRYIMFLDNLFAPDKKWLKEFAPAYKKNINLPFFCETNPNVHDVETINLLALAGCSLLQFGLQSTNEEVRRNILHRKETNDRIRELIKYAKDNRIFVCVDHIANLPSETKEHLDEAITFYRQVRPDWVNLGFLQYYPRAEILEISRVHKQIFEEDIPYIVHGKKQTSFRLLSKSDLGFEYRILPMRFFCAFKLPRWIGDNAQKILDKKIIARLLSPLGSIFIYASRILLAFTDKRDFLVRHHVLRNLNVMAIVFKEKFL